MIKAALFDLDGVVLDTETQYTTFWGSQCLRYYPNMPGLEQKIKGMTLVQILDAYFPDDTQRRAIVTALDAFEQRMDYSYIAGFEDFVTGLRARGIRTAVVTSSNRPKMESVYLKRPELRGYFDRILTSEDFERSKPDPDCYLKAAAAFGVEVSECVGFEDSINGLKSLRAAHIYTVGLATTNPHERIAPLSDRVVADFTSLDLPGLLAAIG